MSHFHRREHNALLPRQIFSTFLLIASLLLTAVPVARAQTDYGRLTIVVEGMLQKAPVAVSATVTVTSFAKQTRTCSVSSGDAPPARCMFRTLEPGELHCHCYAARQRRGVDE